MRNDWKDLLIISIFWLIIACTVLVFNAYLSMPVVYYSSATGQCVKVDSEHGYTCENVPEKHVGKISK